MGSTERPIGSGASAPCAAGRGARGRVTMNVDPSPSSPHASSRPPCSRVSSVAIARPSPDPPVVRLREGSARQNRSNTRCTCSGLMPMPWSTTANVTASSSAATSTSTGRPSACSIALFTRLRRIRSIRRGSTQATWPSARSRSMGTMYTGTPI